MTTYAHPTQPPLPNRKRCKLSESVTVLPAEAFDELVASLDEPAVPNKRTQDAFRRLDEVVKRRPEDNA